MPQPIYKTILDNGLTVALREMRHAPVTSFWVWYKVGSRNERPGLTGASHWVEHMMFKGSDRFPNGSLDRAVSREGGRWNAFTWLDFTAYYETMPADRIDLALQLEADRMVNASFDPDDLETERTVILAERQMYENEPLFLLREELSAAAFRVHPYHHEVIGDEADLRGMSRDDLYGHYRRYYAPQNATVVAVGDFQMDEMLDRIKAEFGQIPSGQPAEPVTRAEPPQRGERRVTVQGPGETAYLIYAYRSPAASHDDYFPLALLNAAFSGGGSLGFIGSGGSNKSSRLYKALVASELTAAVSGSVAPTIDPYLYSITAVLRPGRQVAEVEAALQAEIERLAAAPITQAELDKALKRAKAQFVMAGESVTGQAQMIGLAESVIGDYSWFETALERLSAVTLDDIERVRQNYLTAANRTVGIYEPET
jgi:zinc protease